MSLSARNQLKGVITQIKMGAVNAEVTIEVAPSIELVSTLTKKACEELELAVGKEAWAIIKAPNVLMAVEEKEK